MATPGAGAPRWWVGGLASRSWTIASLVRAVAGMRASSSRLADDRDVAVVGDRADDRDRQAPALADLADLVPALRAGRPRTSAPGSRRS